MDIVNSWTSDQEEVLELIRQNSVKFQEHHKKMYFFYKSLIKYFRLPSIILSAFGSVSAVGLQNYIDQQHISALTCGLALVVGILNSIELFLKLNDQLENELANSKAFYTLSIDIQKTLKLNPSNRGITGSKYLDAKYATFQKLTENGNITTKVKDVLTILPKTSRFSKKKKDDSSIESEPSQVNIDIYQEEYKE